MPHLHVGAVLGVKLGWGGVERVVGGLERDHEEERFALVVILNDRLGAFTVHLSGEQPCSIYKIITI